MNSEIRICPNCKKEYSGYPAISRKDNKTEICSQCGIDEAVSIWLKYINKDEEE